MKYIQYLTFLFLAACTQSQRDANDTTKCMLAAMAELHTNEIVPLPDERFAFIARLADGSVWRVECNSDSSTKITSKYQLFLPPSTKMAESN